MKEQNWIWMPHPAHFICARDCKFFLATYVGGYIVSTVGELWLCRELRKIRADVRGVVIEGIGDEWDNNYFKKFGYEDIGCDRKYETMVFKAEKRKGKPEEVGCCPFHIIVSKEKDFRGYNSPLEATKGHYELCKKWSKPKNLSNKEGV